MSNAAIGDTVKVHYTGKLKDGTIFDSSKSRKPLEFKLGNKQVIPGFENALIGLKSGDSVTVEIPPDKAYGNHEENLVINVNRDQLPAEIDPQVGMQLETSTPDGRRIPVTVTEVTDSKVTIDANHPLAGKVLHFDIEVVEILKSA